MENPTSLPLMKRIIVLAHDYNKRTYQHSLQTLDQKINHLKEQLQSRPSVPTELQDDYRKEIDALTLENMQLTLNLEKLNTTLKRANDAYKEEVKQNSLLEHKLDDLEQRLLGLLRKGKMN